MSWTITASILSIFSNSAFWRNHDDTVPEQLTTDDRSSLKALGDELQINHEVVSILVIAPHRIRWLHQLLTCISCISQTTTDPTCYLVGRWTTAHASLLLSITASLFHSWLESNLPTRDCWYLNPELLNYWRNERKMPSRILDCI